MQLIEPKSCNYRNSEKYAKCKQKWEVESEEKGRCHTLQERIRELKN